MIITEMGVIEVTPQGLVLKEIHPEFTVEQVPAVQTAVQHLLCHPAQRTAAMVHLAQRCV